MRPERAAGHGGPDAAEDAGVWVFGGGLHSYEEVSVVATDGTVTDGPYPEAKAYIGGFSVVDVPSREAALLLDEAQLEGRYRRSAKSLLEPRVVS